MVETWQKKSNYNCALYIATTNYLDNRAITNGNGNQTFFKPLHWRPLKNSNAQSAPETKNIAVTNNKFIIIF